MPDMSLGLIVRWNLRRNSSIKCSLPAGLFVRDVNSGGHEVPVCSHGGKTAPFIEPLPLQ